MIIKFHDDPTVNESGIVVLLGQIWVYMGKRELHARDISLTIDIILQIPTVWMCENEL